MIALIMTCHQDDIEPASELPGRETASLNEHTKGGELEGKGVEYERYALGRLFAWLVRQHRISSVLEIPAKGEKAMPSLYSLGFGEAGCDVTLINAEKASMWAWDVLEFPVTCQESTDLTNTGLENSTYDLVWNFMALSHHDDPEAFLTEMTRLSRRYILFVSVNRFNPGFLSHRLAHRISGIGWCHGDIRFMNPFLVARFMSEKGLNVVKIGAVDTPPYPDSLGFRDIRLHRMNVDLNQIEWNSRTIGWMKSGRYPAKIKLFYLLERLPMPLVVKLLYAHLFYVVAEIPRTSV